MPNQDFDLIQSTIKQNMAEINEAICRAARISGRSADDILVLAISKRQPVEVIDAAYQCGQRAFGESYVQEALEKMVHFSEFEDMRWDMVGHVQSRKARQVAEKFHAVHSVDSLKLANLLHQFRPTSIPPLEVFLEVNIGDESTKTGFSARNDEDWQALNTVVRQILELKRLKLVGLMAMPPLFPEPELSRPYFKKLRQLKDYINDQMKEAVLAHLSAGTSADFEIAIEEGATVVRIGERFLGPRKYTD